MSVFFIFLGCEVNGRSGDGTKRGTCTEGHLCRSDGTCITGVYILQLCS